MNGGASLPVSLDGINELSFSPSSLAGRLRIITDIAPSLISAGSCHALHSALAGLCRRVIPFDAFFVRGLDAESGKLFNPGGHPLDRILEVPGWAEKRVIQERRSILARSASDQALMRSMFAGRGFVSQSAIWTPVQAGNNLMGIISVHSREPGEYTAADVEVLEVLAALAATSMINARYSEERQEAETVLRAREHELSEAQRLAHLGSWRWKIGSSHLEWSDEMYRIHGLSPGSEAVSIEDFEAMVHPDDRERLRAHIDRARLEGLPYEDQFRILRPDGSIRVLLGRGEVICGPECEPCELFGTALDVTEQEESEVLLRASEESYRTIFELASDAIFVHDVKTGNILDANQKACELHGCTLDELKALGVGGISDGTPPYDRLHAWEYMCLARDGRPQRFEWRMRRKTGERFWVEVNLHRVNILAEDRILASVRNIDERKQAEEALQRARDELELRVQERTAELQNRTDDLIRAEQRFRAIVESSPTPLLMSRLEDGVVFYVNDRLAALIGAPPLTLIGKKTTEFYYDLEDRPRIIEMIQQQGFVRDHELRIRVADGSPRWVSLSIQRLVFDGTPALVTAFIDITERRKTSDALRASEESYRGLFDNLTELVYIQGLDGCFVNVNEAVVRTYGYTREEIIGQTPALLADPDRVNLADTLECFHRAVAGEPQRFEWWGRRKDGSTFPKEVVLTRSTYFGQDVVIAVARDISDRVAAETALRRSEEHFRRLTENASDLISIMDVQGTVQYQSPAARTLLGYDPSELVGQNAFDYLAPDDVAPTLERWQGLIENPGKPVRADFRFRHRDGTWRHLEAVGTTLSPDSIAHGVVVNSRDITERKAAERTLRLQKTILEAEGEASIDGILVISEDGEVLSYNHRFVEMWGIPDEVVVSRSDRALLEAVLEKLKDPEAFLARVEYLYAHPSEKARDEIALRDGSVFDRYTAPVISSDGERYGRIWFFRDMTDQKRHAEELEQARREAERAREQASHYAESLERELEFGRQIQQGLFPASLPQPPGWEMAVRFHPVWQVAGDFYDAFELPTGRIGLLVADVSGKGVGAALFMTLFQSLLRASAERSSAIGVPDEELLIDAVQATNDYITRVHRHAHMFASVFFGLLDPATGRLRYVNAGHEPPVQAGSGEPVRLGPTGPALGLFPGASFVVGTTTLAEGDTLLAYTDGITEARNSDREFFTEERLISLFGSSECSAAGLLDRIDQAVIDFTGHAAPADDMTLLAIRRG